MSKSFIVLEAIRPNPKDYPSSVMKNIDSAIYNVLTNEVKNIVKDAMDKRVVNWDTKPVIVRDYRRPNKDTFILHVRPGMANKYGYQLWKWVSRGTHRSGTVSSKGKYPMVFSRGYYPKTAGGNKYGRSSYSYGAIVRAHTVKASSIKGRHFEEYIVKEESGQIKRIIKKRVEEAIRRS